jgi:hypothetical protein
MDFHSFAEPEQLVLLKNFELDDKYRLRNGTPKVLIEISRPRKALTYDSKRTVKKLNPPRSGGVKV